MKVCLGSEQLQEHACTIFWMVVDCEEREEVALSLNLLPQVQKAMRAHKQHPGVQEEGCRAISHLASSSEESRAATLASGVLVNVQAAMKSHLHVAGVREQAVWALLNLTHGANKEQEEAVKEVLLMTSLRTSTAD
mmetsp:Transcript_9280/g.26552  ORF Transcript_9280/g.26552 Transcript_9280/m.26552 type:complete len:136 (-) Transcript_9280:1943-2350(-)